MREPTETALLRSIHGVQSWVENHGYRGYEPFDGLLSWARPLTFGQEFPQRLLQQLVRQSPVNIRPLMGVHPQESTKGRGYMAWGYLLLSRATGQTEYLGKARQCLEWLDRHKAARFTYHSWANHFDFVSRGGAYTSRDPIIVWTSLIGHSFLEGYEVTGDEWFLRVAESAANWVLDLPRESTSAGVCLSYLPDRQLSIHNANLLGAGFLARTARFTDNRKLLDVARAAVEYSCARQKADGSWWYGEDAKYQWVDNFHTAYNLDALKYYETYAADGSFSHHAKRGLSYYVENFFTTDGCPKYYHDRVYPIDIQCASQSIDTLAFHHDADARCLALALKVADWTIRHMQARDGHFYYRRYPMMVARTAMLHWGQATTFKAMARLYAATAGVRYGQ